MDFSKIDRLKATIDKTRPFEGDMLKELQAYYRVGLTYSSNALEGNTLTISETKILLEDGLTVGGKPLRDTFEALGHAKAYDFMFTLLRKREILESDALTMHKLFFTGIDANAAGVYRKKAVFITGSEYPVTEVKKIAADMAALFQWANGERAKYHPVEFAALLHKRFVFVHPFIDGNGRLTRLLMNTALIQDGYMMAIIPPVLRSEYISLLEKAHTNDNPFVEFIAGRVYETEYEPETVVFLGVQPVYRFYYLGFLGVGFHIENGLALKVERPSRHGAVTVGRGSAAPLALLDHLLYRVSNPCGGFPAFAFRLPKPYVGHQLVGMRRRVNFALAVRNNLYPPCV
ncbi:MAG: Fic family protein [Firmicutes bacterium]|nr:Fic family protein [Bacillota bacterium]